MDLTYDEFLEKLNLMQSALTSTLYELYLECNKFEDKKEE